MLFELQTISCFERSLKGGGLRPKFLKVGRGKVKRGDLIITLKRGACWKVGPLLKGGLRPPYELCISHLQVKSQHQIRNQNFSKPSFKIMVNLVNLSKNCGPWYNLQKRWESNFSSLTIFWAKVVKILKVIGFHDLEWHEYVKSI